MFTDWIAGMVDQFGVEDTVCTTLPLILIE
jgi:hypothetical protein